MAINIIFIGSGALLVRALKFIDGRHPHKLICCPTRDSALPALRAMNAKIMASNNINHDLYPVLVEAKSGIVFSISNKQILDNSLLATGWRFFNIHNGLVQDYRGVAEICLLAALCQQSAEYGVTMHEILPHQEVDCGPVLYQNKFNIDPDINFEQLVTISFRACDAIFRENFDLIVSTKLSGHEVPVCSVIYNYSMVSALLDAAPRQRLEQATYLGLYQNSFPHLHSKISKWYESKR